MVPIFFNFGGSEKAERVWYLPRVLLTFLTPLKQETNGIVSTQWPLECPSCGVDGSDSVVSRTTSTGEEVQEKSIDEEDGREREELEQEKE
ncbi:hypothetical protein E2C01_088253 [Portunus trituberculatus]|uniref:Uncharacterized protein n=1 Tax=Portunus trituberculatus TaxID=210409 RepID=A0A5B7J5M8_PORTR|nr:hypothetical protein [Portunus trituberculatus]